jgi:uncharacterized coiled-coil protein SlyX
MSVSNGWTLPVITVNCGSSGGDTSALQAELDENNAFDTALASRVSSVETNLLQETKERKADVSSVFSGLQYEETARKSDVSSLTSRMNDVEAKNTSQDGSLVSLTTRVSDVETKNSSQDVSIAGLNTSLGNTTITLLNRIGAVETKNTSQDDSITGLTTRVFDVETKNTSQDDSINTLSFQMQAVQNNVSAISLVNTGASFGAPGATASLVHATSSNPSFKVKGLTASNSILFGVSTDSVDVSIDPALIGRISTLETKNSSQDTSITSLNTSIASIQSSVILNCTINGSAHTVGFQRVGSIVCMMVPAKLTTGSSIVIIFSTALPQIYRLSSSGSQSMSTSIMITDNGVSKASNVSYLDDQGRINITTPNGFSGVSNYMPVWSMTYSTALVI